MSLVASIGASCKPGASAPSNPSAIVSGAGTSEANGEYQPAGTSNGRPFYTTSGTNPEANAISWDGVGWNIFSSGGSNLYLSNDDVAFPWLATWELNDGDSPAPSLAPSSATAVVAGAGTSAANGVYTYRGFTSGKPYYNLVGQPDDSGKSAITENNNPGHNIYSSQGATLYEATDDVAFPWQSSEWFADSGAEPPPTVTQG